MKYNHMAMMAVITLVIFSYNLSFSFGFSEKERNTMNLQTFVVSDFGDDFDHSHNIGWKARFSRFAKPVDIMDPNSPVDANACNISYIEAKPLGLPQEVDQKQKFCLGIKAEFIKKGYNWIEIYPVHNAGSEKGKDSGSDATPTNITLVGVVKSLDMWVWGGNYNYWLEFYLYDYKGFLHRLPAGDISYVGWRNLRTKIPEYIPQVEHHVPFKKPLKLNMIKLWSYPTERVDQFYCYFDYMQVQTDVYMERFNGDDLAEAKW